MMLQAKGIVKKYGALEVLKGVDFCAQEGQMLAIMGPSGAGKTTLLQILGTLSKPTEGSLIIDGAEVYGPGRNLSEDELARFRSSKIGFVFQSHHLLPEFTALENVMIPLLIAGTSKKDAKARALQLLQRVGLKDRIGHKPSELSGGESQRVAIARALACNPAVLFADEPTGNLDSATKEEIHALLLSIRADLGQTIIIVTHDPALSAICDKTYHMVDGKFI